MHRIQYNRFAGTAPDRLFHQPRDGPSPALDADPASSSLLALLQVTPGIGIDPVALTAQVLLLILLLLASALFSGSEVALFSLDLSAKENLADEGDPPALRVLALLEHPRALLVSILILNTLVNVCAAILSAVMVASVATVLGWSPTWTVVVEMVVLTFVLLVVSEITPKLIASRSALTFSRRVSGVILGLHRLLGPISHRLARLMNTVQTRFKTAENYRMSAEDLKAMAEIGEAHGTIEQEERDLIHSIVEFGETTVREVMTSRLDVEAVPVTATLDEALGLIRQSGHSRLPLYVDHLDNILGIVYAKDLIPYLASRPDGGEPVRIDWTRIARPPMFVPLGKKLDDLLKDFQSRKMHLALVVDEYGGTAGLVTLEDLLEEIVGDIRDEHDEQEDVIFERIDRNTFRFDGRIDLDELNDVLGTEIDTEDFDFETLGGLIYHLTGSIPAPGDEITYESLHMQVETVESHRIGQVIVRFASPQPEESVSEESTATGR
ncbi:MAG TPA: hemolysin family protein [Rhodothermales bacterium]|nr:hemolysin family protein [Rhodothermales bacterium]